jgi:hypothetical protein
MPTKSFNYLAFQSFDFERTLLRLFQKHVVETKFDIYVFISRLLGLDISLHKHTVGIFQTYNLKTTTTSHGQNKEN